MGKRVLAYFIDTLVIIIASLIFSFGTMAVLGIVALLLLPFSYDANGEILNTILLVVYCFFLIPFYILTIIPSIGINLTFKKTVGYKIVGLKVNSDRWFKLFMRWFLRTGIIPLFFFVYICNLMYDSNFDSYSYIKICITFYVIYIVFNNIFVLFTKKKKPFIDSLLNIEVEMDNRKLS